jgi:hypothetical protein
MTNFLRELNKGANITDLWRQGLNEPSPYMVSTMRQRTQTANQPVDPKVSSYLHEYINPNEPAGLSSAPQPSGLGTQQYQNIVNQYNTPEHQTLVNNLVKQLSTPVAGAAIPSVTTTQPMTGLPVDFMSWIRPRSTSPATRFY